MARLRPSRSREPAPLPKSETLSSIGIKVLTTHRVRFFLLALGLLTSLACQTGPRVRTVVEETPEGVLMARTVEQEATVAAIDASRRTVTLQPRRGDPITLKVGEGAINFEQIRIGDRVHAKFIEETAISLVPGGSTPPVGAARAVALAPEGALPGGVMANTVGVTGTVVAIDGHARTVTLRLPDGRTKEFNVSRSRDLSQVGLGDSVFLQVTEAIAISVTRAQ